MRGFYREQEYYWIESYPTGYLGGMQLQWYLTRLGPKDARTCTVSLPDGPRASLPEQAVSSVAIPTVINGQPVTFQGYLWYSHPNYQQDFTQTLSPAPIG